MLKRASFGRALAAASCLLPLGGCAATTPPPRFSAVSPADPAAPEGVVPAPAPLLTGAGELAEKDSAPGSDLAPDAGARPAPSPAGHEHHGAAGETKVYTCSMHPEVAAEGPGKCPVCGMALVRKAAAPKERP